MPNPVITVRDQVHGTTREPIGTAVWMWCPGCDDPHNIYVAGANVTVWGWDGNRESPTFSPSVLVNYGTVAGVPKRCHSFVRAGRWEFLTDSTHALAGQTVPMVPVPDWLFREAEESA